MASGFNAQVSESPLGGFDKLLSGLQHFGAFLVLEERYVRRCEIFKQYSLINTLVDVV